MSTQYVVMNENTLGYTGDGVSPNMMGVLAGSLLKDGHSWLNGPVAVVPSVDRLRPATAMDFDTFRVQCPPDFHEQPEAPKSVAREILAQLGGRRFLMMTGAKNLMSTENSLTFKVPSAKNKITHVRVTLDPSDTYTVEFLNCRRTQTRIKQDVVAAHSDVYNDQLQAIFTQETGLHTHL